MSNQLLILGNGFDLHCGLKSSYKDFFRYTILDTIGARFGLVQLKAGTYGFWEHLLLEYYKKFGEEDYNWCDIERIIKNVLSGILTDDPSNDFNIRSEILSSVRCNLDLYQQKNYGADESIKKYILIYCVNLLEQATVNFITDNEMLEYLAVKLLTELKNFERRFCKYIKDCIFDKENNINEPYIVNAVNLLAYITEFSTPNFEDIDDMMEIKEEYYEEEMSTNVLQHVMKEKKVLMQEFNKLRHTNILSFNYTAIFDILGVDSPCIYSNVHGKLCNKQCSEDCVSSSVIFGIDDKLIQLQKTNELRLFSKTYRKMSDTSTPISILPKNDGRPIEIKFYGHSLSEADYSYFQSIFDFYNLYDNYNVSLLFYYSKGYEQNDEIYRLINSYGKTLENKDRGKNLIHKLLLENRLKIVEVPENI
ncbi:MAG: hypothetical protein HFJ21_07140 [Clostridia bacterium]|jgi:hypothetical protein|nr:hypothetical protein [Clostridia bacterium]MCI9460199.1 hypothetical protein [Clostridia bacterium]